MTDPNAQPVQPDDPTPAEPALPPLPLVPDPVSASSASPAGPPAPPSAAGPHSPTPPASSRSRRASRGLVVVLAPILAVLVFSAGVFFGNGPLAQAQAQVAPSASPAASGKDADLALIEEAWRAIQDNYVDAKNLDNQKVAYGAIRGLVAAVGDEGHTSFMTADEVRASEQSLAGTFVGIGVQMAQDNNKPVVGAVIPGTPAEAAGLKRGDQIVAVDGKTTDGETIDETVSRIRGPEGESVTLTLGRAGVTNFDVTIVRRKFDLPLVSWSMVPGRKVAMIRLDQFSTGATKALQGAIKSAKDAGATALVLDLRDNPGGYVNEAIGVASQFLADGIVYQSVDASGKEQDQPVEKGGVATDIPLVVLTNGETASSAEIVTGAIQDAKRGTVVGEKTFGTGTVLGRFDLADGSSLRIGTERWLTRDGRPIWHEGLDPDVTVKLADTATPVRPDDLRAMTAAELAASTDTQLLKALEQLQGKG